MFLKNSFNNVNTIYLFTDWLLSLNENYITACHAAI